MQIVFFFFFVICCSRLLFVAVSVVVIVIVIVVLISITIRSVFSMNPLGKGEMCRFSIFGGKMVFSFLALRLSLFDSASGRPGRVCRLYNIYIICVWAWGC